MDHEKFKRLEEKFKNKSFNKSYKAVNATLYIFSYIGNIASVFFAYFFLYSLLIAAIGDLASPIVLSASSIIFLSSFELLKRYVFNTFALQFTTDHLKFKSREILILAFFSLVLITSSFYLSLNGAHKFADKTKNIETVAKDDIKVYTDSINKVYDLKILDLKNENIRLEDQNVKHSDEAETTKSNSIRRQKLRLVESNNMTIKDNKIKITSYENEVSNKITEFKNETVIEKKGLTAESNETSNKFVIWSTFIEFFILVGIFFNNLYLFRSYKEKAESSYNSPAYHTWNLCDQVLEIIYKDGSTKHRLGTQIMDISDIIELVKMERGEADPKELEDVFKIFSHLKIIHTKNEKSIFTSDYATAKDNLKKHFKI